MKNKYWAVFKGRYFTWKSNNRYLSQEGIYYGNKCANEHKCEEHFGFDPWIMRLNSYLGKMGILV